MRRAPSDQIGRGSALLRPLVIRGAARRTARPPDRPSAVVLTEVVLLQRHCLAGARAEGVLGAVVVGPDGVDRRLGLFGRLDPDVAVLRHAGTGRDELSEDDVLLETQ